MARRTRSFLFDNISKRLVQNTNKTAKEINTRKAANTTANTDILTKAEVETVISNTSIATLSDTTIANVANEQVLQYNANTAKWENETLSLVSSVDGLTDTNLTSPSNGDYLVYSSSGSEWINRSLDLSSYVTDTDIADYSNTAQMNTAIAASNTAMKSYVDAEVAGVVNSAPAALDTLNELAAALGDDANFATTTSTALGNRLRIDVSNQSLTGTQQTNALTNLGITATVAELNYVDGVTSNIQTQLDAKGTSSFSGAYADLTGKPTIPTNNNQLTNGAGYITSSFISDEGTYTGDLDNLTAGTDQGFYHWGSTQPTNSPGWNYGGLFVVRDNNQNIQLAIGNSGNGTQRLAIRRADGGSYTGNSWTEFWSTADFSSTKISNWDTAYGWGNHASAGYSTFSGSYNDLTNKPTIPTNNNQLTNGAGYITVSNTDFFNNQGRVHANVTNFNATSLRAGVNYLNGGTNGPTGSGQWYGFRLGLGSQYGTQTGTTGHYASEFYWGRKGQTSNNYYIYTRDLENGSWGSWVKMHAGYADSAGSVAWSNVTGTPTIPTNNNQLTNGAGYITNSGGTTAATANTVAKRNGSADINARLFRSSYGNQSTISGAIAYRVSTSDNYIRFCSDGAAIRSFIGAGTSNFNGAYSSLSGRPTLGGGTPYLDLATGNYGTVKVDDDRGVTWAGYAIRDDWAFMSSGASAAGIYNDTDNEWMLYFARNAQTQFYYNGSNVAQTTSVGLNVSSRISTGSTYLDVKYGATGGGGARLYDADGVVQSHWYGNGSGEGGLLDNDGSWFCRARTGTSANIFYCNGNNELYVYTSYVRAIGSFRAPIYYDFNNTSYYAHLDSTSDSIRAAGNIVAYYSDERLKDISGNIENALDKVCTLDGFYYRPNEIAQKYGYKDKQHVGLSAQQVQKVLPEVIKSAPVDAEYMTVDYASVVPLLVEAIKELKAEIEELKK